MVVDPIRHMDKIVMKGKGMPKYNPRSGVSSDECGDLIVEISVEHPKTAILSNNVSPKIAPTTPEYQRGNFFFAKTGSKKNSTAKREIT